MIPRAMLCCVCSPKLSSTLSMKLTPQSHSHLRLWRNGIINFQLGERAIHSQPSGQVPVRGQVHGQLSKSYRPRRAMMYVPGSDVKKMKKIPTLEADCICLDCEDGVAVTKKNDARSLIRKTLDDPKINFGRSERTVRVNSVESGFCEEDLKEILSVKHLPTSIHLPKVESVDQIKWFLSKADPLLKNRSKKELPEPMNLLIFVESAHALLSLVEITRGAIQVCKNTNFIPDGLVFGSDDYCASMGATRSNEASEILYARQYVATVAKAFQLQAIDIVYIDFKDQAGLIEQSVAGAAMGYTGKQVIHPTQVSICHEAFAPTLDKIKWATKLLKEFEKHTKSGKGAFVYEECMIDMPLVLQARNIVNLASNLKSVVDHEKELEKEKEKKKGKDDDDSEEQESESVLDPLNPSKKKK